MRPKPMVEIGGKPILWHIMKIYAAHGIEEFVICLGYKGYMIKEYFANYYLHTCDVTFDLAQRRHGGPPLGDRAVEGHAGRHRRGDDDRRAAQARAAATWSDRGLLLHLRRRRRRHRHHRARSPSIASRASWRRSRRCSRRGVSARSTSTASECSEFEEKPRGDGAWINGGFFVLSPGVDRIHRRRRRPSGSRSRCARWRATASLRASATRASGSRWTRCAIATSSRSCGLGAPHGGHGLA